MVTVVLEYANFTSQTDLLNTQDRMNKRAIHMDKTATLNGQKGHIEWIKGLFTVTKKPCLYGQ